MCARRHPLSQGQAAEPRRAPRRRCRRSRAPAPVQPLLNREPNHRPTCRHPTFRQRAPPRRLGVAKALYLDAALAAGPDGEAAEIQPRTREISAWIAEDGNSCSTSTTSTRPCKGLGVGDVKRLRSHLRDGAERERRVHPGAVPWDRSRRSRRHRVRMRQVAAPRNLDVCVWYAHIEVGKVLKVLKGEAKSDQWARAEANIAKDGPETTCRHSPNLTHEVDGQRGIIAELPVDHADRGRSSGRRGLEERGG